MSATAKAGPFGGRCKSGVNWCRSGRAKSPKGARKVFFCDDRGARACDESMAELEAAWAATLGGAQVEMSLDERSTR